MSAGCCPEHLTCAHSSGPPHSAMVDIIITIPQLRKCLADLSLATGDTRIVARKRTKETFNKSV